MLGQRKVIHIDMDAFYASVEQRDQPQYRQKPLVVGGRPDKRGAVAAASYEARQYGIHSAMPSRIAQQRCPHLIFVQPRFEVYREVSQQIRAIFTDYTELVEPLALDEAYLDVTQNKREMASAVAIAREIKARIWHETQLTASAGVSVNKFISKVASGMNKPDGLTVIVPEVIASFVESLPIEKFYGVGQVTASKMKHLGIHTGADLKQWSEQLLVKHFGKLGCYYYQAARGYDDRPVNPDRIRQSIGAERSFDPDLIRWEVLQAELGAIAQKVYERLEEQQRAGHTLTLKLKYGDYQQITRSRTLPKTISQVEEIQAIAESLLIKTLELGRPVRLLGITLSNLEVTSAIGLSYQQLQLFEEETQ